MEIECSAAFGWFELDDAISGGREQTLAVQVFRIRKYLRDASVMDDDRRRIRARRGGCFFDERALLRRRKKIQPIAQHARHDGSQSGPQTQAIDKCERCEKHSKAIWIRENRADGAALDSIEQRASVMA